MFLQYCYGIIVSRFELKFSCLKSKGIGKKALGLCYSFPVWVSPLSCAKLVIYDTPVKDFTENVVGSCSLSLSFRSVYFGRQKIDLNIQHQN